MVMVDIVEKTLDVKLEGGVASSLGVGSGDVIGEGETGMDGI